jgi:hypothetical protein
MKAVIFKPPQGNPKVDRLVDYIYRLSKVTVEVISWSKEPEWLNLIGRRNESFRHVANKINETFVWLEPDSIPLTEDWLEELKERWEERDKAIIGLLSTDFHTPNARIGVYSPAIRGLIPQGLMTHNFDQYIKEFREHRIERTGLIQHSYGMFDDKFNLIPHKFPQDNWMLRETSVIFHSDKNQDIITQYDTPEQEERLTP